MNKRVLILSLCVAYIAVRFLTVAFSGATKSPRQKVAQVQSETVQEQPSVAEQASSASSQALTEYEEKDGVISFKVYPPANFNDKTKNDIYDIRRMNVGKSPFFPENYSPSEEVFGQIVSSKPWYGKFDRPCASVESNITRGESLLSTVINNPNALIAPFPLAKSNNLDLNSDYCKANDAMLFVPSKIEYTQSKKLLEITYPIDEVIIGHNKLNKNLWLDLIALNARDAGYNYITATDIQGGYFYDSTWDNYSQSYKPYDNITKIVFNFHDYIHLGTSCGLPSGCNNISPRQAPMEFALNARPAKIQLKLWKKEPTSRNSAPDLYCNLIFE